MRREKINEFISSTVVRELIEHNLDLLDFMRGPNDVLSQSSLTALSIILRERDAMIKLLADKVLHLNDEDHDEEEVPSPKKANSTNKRREIIGIQTFIKESDRAQSSTDYIPTKWKTVRFINLDTGKVIKEFCFVEGNSEMENVVEYWRKAVKDGNSEKMIKFFHADGDSNELM